MAYVANDFKQKGTARWMPMIFVGISENKQYIVLHGKTMRLTRSIKRILPDASQHLASYQHVLVCSWMCEGVVGTRLKPSTAKHLRADTGQDIDLEDEAAFDPRILKLFLATTCLLCWYHPLRCRMYLILLKLFHSRQLHHNQSIPWQYNWFDIYSGCFYGLCRGD